MFQFTLPGQGRLATARQLHNDALTFMARKRFDKALANLTEALRLRRAVLLPSDEMIIATMELLAHVHQLVGNRKEALDLQREIVTQKQARLGAHHPDVAESTAKLADLQAALGYVQDAARSNEQVWHNRTVTRAEAFLADFEQLMGTWRLPDHVLASVDPDSLDARRRQLDLATRADVRGDIQTASRRACWRRRRTARRWTKAWRRGASTRASSATSPWTRRSRACWPTRGRKRRRTTC